MILADQVRAKKRKAAAISFLAVLLTFVLLLALGVVALPWAIIVGFFVYLRMIRANKYVVWLRRFHRDEPTRLRFNLLLNRVCPGLCVPITLQDSVFKTSYYSSGSRMILVAPVVFGLATLLYLLCALTIGVGMGMLGVGNGLDIALGLVIALVPLVFFGHAIKTQMFRRGHVELTVSKAAAEVDSTLQKITQRKLGFQGVMIFRCPDVVWRQVVSVAISRASAVIIDVSDLTENVLWELKSALETKHPESVLITFGFPQGSREELPSSVRAQLEKEVGSESVLRLRVFYYPAEQPPPGLSRSRLYTDLSNRLSTELGACIQSAAA